jgi:integrase/recombinase XerD
MTALRRIVDDYLAMRRGLGYKLEAHEDALHQFVSFFRASRAARLTTTLALKWARRPQGTDPAWWTERLSILRGFASYWKTVDPRVEVPPPGLLVRQYRRPAPHIYSDDEIRRILAAAKDLPSTNGLRQWTYSALFGLLWATGLRVGEARSLDRSDVDLNEDVITVRQTKFNKSRLIPLHPSTSSALRRYAAHRDRIIRNPRAEAFFLMPCGGRVSKCMAWETFRLLLHKTGIRALSSAYGPRVHDLRHTFAVKVLVRFYKEGLDIDRKIHALSTYLGHRGVNCTYWYLSAVPELLHLAMLRMEKGMGGVL